MCIQNIWCIKENDFFFFTGYTMEIALINIFLGKKLSTPPITRVYTTLFTDLQRVAHAIATVISGSANRPCRL